jgi:putative transposase
MKTPLIISEQQRQLLLSLSNSRTASNNHIQRSRIILLCAAGKTVTDIAMALGINPVTVSKWRKRWQAQADKLMTIEHQSDTKPSAYRQAIKEVLNDAPRSGTPTKFTEEQLCQILAVACEKPEDSELPFSHWSLQSLADELQKRGIVERISTSHLADFLKNRQAAAA